MCFGCWKELGSPKIDTPAIRDAAAKIGRVYEYNCVGGGLHVVIDDFNVEGDKDERITRYAEHDADYSPEQIKAEEECAAALDALTIPERASALALYDGFWALPTQENTK